MSDGRGLLEELKRRHVWRVAVAYAIAGWLIVQIATQVFPFFNIPNWSVRMVVILIAIGFPVAVAFAWIYELTPEGIRRTAPVDSPDARAEHEHRQIGRKLNAIIVTVVVLAVALLGWRFYAARRETAPSQTANVAATASATPVAIKVPVSVGVRPVPAKSIAVLPFENLSNDKDNDYFVAGMQDLILTKLADIGDLKVIARTSTAKYASHPDDLKSIGRQLGVATILEGSVQKQGKQVLINVQLIDTGTQSHLWAQDYTRSLDNVFGVEGEVAEKIANALDAKLSSAETARLAAVPTRNEAAYDLFLRAEYQRNKAIRSGYSGFWSAAIPLYQQAIEKDPGFALAYARLSYVESGLARQGGAGQDVAQLNAQAFADAEQALKMAPGLVAAHLALGYNVYWGHLDYEGALKAFSKALALRPNDPEALDGQGLVQRRMGRFDAAIASFEQAFAQNPRDSALAEDLSSTFMFAERYPDAERWAQRALTLDPDYIVAMADYAHSILLGTGDVARALSVVTGKSDRVKLGVRVPLLIYQRQYQRALRLLDSIEPRTTDRLLLYVSIHKPQTEAELYRWMGAPSRAKLLYARVLPELRALLNGQDDTSLAEVWSRIAEAELGLGRIDEGLDALQKSQAIASASRDRLAAVQVMQKNAWFYAQAARADLAVPLLAKALATPGIGAEYSPVLLWLDPRWDPIRRDARFQALLQQYAKYKPAVIYDVPPVAH